MRHRGRYPGDDDGRSQQPEIRRLYFRNRHDGRDVDRHDGGEILRRRRLHDRGHRVRPPVVADRIAMSAGEVSAAPDQRHCHHRKRQQSDEADRDRTHAMRRLPQRH